MARIMGGIVHRFDMREANETDDEQAQCGGCQRLRNLRCFG